ncbi:SGNH/GDSL hydrolase family protein [Ideonella sp.]|uniref:SGNH/GDSL hydrolase family protein n=1 Tax=Ideonella sp. TaxID=1929293 RepID=UPI0035B01616
MRRTRPLALALILLAGLAGAAAVRSEPLRIMPIGDSITEGGDGQGGYRRPLFERLTAAFGRPNFVGSRSSRNTDPADFLEHDHDGYSAYRIEQIAQGGAFWNALPLEDRLRLWDPAIVLVHAGTNDAQQNYRFRGDPGAGRPGVVARLDDLVSRVVAYNPDIQVLLAQIVPANAPASETTQAYVRALNAEIPALVARHQALGHRVALVDMYTPMLAYPHPDGIHPSPEGYAVMAEQWFRAIQALPQLPANPVRGRADGVVLADRTLWASDAVPAPQANLVRAGAPTLVSARSSGYGGSRSTRVLNDGSLARFTDDADETFTTTFTLDTAAAPSGYTLSAIRTHAGRAAAGNGDERSHQAYEVWWSAAQAPDAYQRLAGAHHVVVDAAETGSVLTMRRPDGQPLATGVARVQFRFAEPPARQYGFIGIDAPAPYREIEVFGEPSAAR